MKIPVIRRPLKAMHGVLGLLTLLLPAQQPESLAPFYATPMEVVEKMLELGELKPGELHYDLGSGDGRFVIMAAQKFGARSVGFEIDAGLVRQSRAKIEALGIGSRARIEQQDLMTADFSKADLITVFLLTESNVKLRPLLEAQMKKGSRVVAHYFPVKGWHPQKTILFAGNGGKGPLYPLYLYRR